MQKLTIKDRIKDVLISNQDVWLNREEIAALAFGEAYIKETALGLNAKISRSITSAKNQLFDEEGLFVAVKYLPRTSKELKTAKRNNKNGKASETNPLISYKIASVEDDQGDILLDLGNRQKKIDNYIQRRDLIVGQLQLSI